MISVFTLVKRLNQAIKVSPGRSTFCPTSLHFLTESTNVSPTLFSLRTERLSQHPTSLVARTFFGTRTANSSSIKRPAANPFPDFDQLETDFTDVFDVHRVRVLITIYRARDSILSSLLPELNDLGHQRTHTGVPAYRVSIRLLLPQWV